VWWKKTGKPARKHTSWFSCKEFFSYDTACRIQYIEQTVLFGFAAYYIYQGEHDKLVPSDGGLLSSALSCATQFGLAMMLMGVAQISEGDEKKVLQYYMVKKVVEFYYLSALTAPASMQAGGEHGLAGVYITTVWFTFCLVHLMQTCYGGPCRRCVFWFAAVLVLFLGGLGLFFPPSTAAAFYRVPDLAGVPQNIFRLVGLGLMVVGTSLAAFSKGGGMEKKEEKSKDE
jgi:uncharacterized protein YjeT (DUF2065 family)